MMFPLFAFGEGTELQKPVICFKPTEFLEAFVKTKQQPIFIEKNLLTNKTNITLFQDNDTGEWTLVEFNKEMICLLAVGKTGQKL